MSGNTRWLTKAVAKLVSDLVIFAIFSAEILLHFHNSVRLAPLKYLM